MSANTKIEWCDHSWSPWRGCTKVSAGCAHCYAETLSWRNPKVLGEWGRGRPRVLAKNWNDPVKWNRNSPVCPYCRNVYDVDRCARCQGSPRKATVFPSLCDWLDEEVDPRWLFDFLALVLRRTPNLNWLLLTKRPELFEKRLRAAAAQCTVDPMDVTDLIYAWIEGSRIPLNVWIGTSVEDQPNADRRIPALLKIPAVGRFLSLEPLLGPVDLKLPSRSFGFPKHITREGYAVGMPQGIHWLIIGGESGSGARACNVEWIRSLVAQGKVAGVATFVKQLGALPIRGANDEPFERMTGRSGSENRNAVPYHPKGGDPAEWPGDIRLREYPVGLR